ncbi:MAG: ATP synthase F0 subunit B [Deltaproteobacteria bacterium]|nr:ATP synthase F0 subunit B [Candidatus Zymogenaceae bacterium]
MVSEFLARIKKDKVLLGMIIFSILAIAGAICVSLTKFGVLSLPMNENRLLEDLAWRIANFSILIIILHVVLTDRVIDFFRNRTQAIREALETSSKAKSEAEKKYQEVADMLSRAKKEIENMHESFIEEGRLERDRLISNAEKEAEKIKIQAKNTAEQEIRAARFALRAEAVELAVELAEELLKKTITEKDLKRITKDYIDKTSELL